MMKLPNAISAFIDLRKLVGYALNPDDPQGGHKARVFKAALGITISDADYLKKAILDVIQEAECTVREQDFYGQRYTVDCKIEFETRSAMVRTNWIVRRDEDFPRLTSCFIKKEDKRNYEK